MNTKELQVFLDNEITSFKKADWIGSLPFQCMIIDTGDDLEDVDSGTIDICQYIPGGIHHNEIDTSITKLRFDASDFPPSGSDDTAFQSTNQTYVKLRMKEMDRECCKNTVNKSLHSTLPTANKVNPLLVSILEQQWDIRNNFYVRRKPQTKYEWLVVLNEEHSNRFHNITYDEENPYNKYIPRFRRVRVVKMDDDGQMDCSCCLFSRFGFGCVHILSVLLFENPGYSGYTQSDVRVFWWNDYRFYAERGNKYDSEGTWDKHYMHLLDNDIVGPRMPTTWNCSSFVARSNTTDDSLFLFKPATERLRNYTSGQAKHALRFIC